MTVTHHVRVYKSEETLHREDQLAWKIAEVAADPVEVEADVVDMIINRIIDNAAVATASLTRGPIVSARAQALAHPVSTGGAGATVFGCAFAAKSSPEWAAWANGVAVRETQSIVYRGAAADAYYGVATMLFCAFNRVFYSGWVRLTCYPVENR